VNNDIKPEVPANQGADPKADPVSDLLLPLRAQIDTLDLQILALLSQRATVAEQVGAIKKASAAPVFRPEREAQVLARLREVNTGPLPSAAITTIYREIMSACRALERRVSVAYLGPEGTYSEQAVVRQFGRSVDTQACASIDEVFRAVESGAADFGVVPVENSTEGSINRTLDLLLQTPLKICAEVALKIQHHLLTRSGTMDGVTKICAHPQALAQCTHWLNTYDARHAPAIERVPLSSNGEAARQAAADASIAAIAGDIAAERYGLQPAFRQIQDEAQNTTRFAVIGTLQTQPSGHDQTALALAVPNKAGAVHAMLAPLATHGVSMTRFESRPSRGRLAAGLNSGLNPGRNGAADDTIWSYYFYIDIEGHQAEPKVAAALAELQALAGYCKIFGSYPVS
jgi:chorismate mutase/prephenate dehydratase